MRSVNMLALGFLPIPPKHETLGIYPPTRTKLDFSIKRPALADRR